MAEVENDLSQEAVAGEMPVASSEQQQQMVYVFSDVFQSDAEKQKVADYLNSELTDVMSERTELEQRWEKWRKQRRARPDSEQRDTPWIKSANIEPPLTAQKVLTIYAKLVGAFSVKKPPVSVEPMNLNDNDTADSLEKMFKELHDNRYGLDMKRKFNRIAYDVVSLGTQVVKVPFTTDQHSFKRKDAGGAVEEVTYVKHKGPEIIPIRLEDFFTRTYWKDIQRAPWVATRYRYFEHELKRFEAQGMFENVEKVLGSNITSYDTNKTSSLEDSGISVGTLKNNEYELFECNVYWDVDGDGYAEDVVVWYEKTSNTILRSEYNPLSVRDYEVYTYIDDPDSLYGIGVCELLEDLQEENTALHRMRLDGTKLAMLKMFLARRGSGIGPNEEFQPFKIMVVDNPREDFVPLEFPDIAQGCILGEQMVKELADRVTGANDYMSGFNDKMVGSGATASGTTFLASQANGILNNILANIEQSQSNMYMLVLYQMIANKSLVDLSFLSDGDQQNIQTVLNMNVEDLPIRFKFSVRTTDINKTDESRKQGFLMISQLYNQYWQQATQVLTAKMNPQLGASAEIQEVLTSAYVGQTKMMEKMIEFFDVGNPADFLPFVDQAKLMMEAADRIRSQQVTQMKGALNGQQGQGANGAMGNVGGGAGIGLGTGSAVPQMGTPVGNTEAVEGAGLGGAGAPSVQM